MTSNPYAHNSVVQWRIKPDATERYFYRVLIFDTKEAMRFYQHEVAKINGTGKYNKFEAITMSCRHYDKRKHLKNQIGQILFYRGRLGAGIVSHEMTHAVLWWASFKGLSIKLFNDDKHRSASDSEERICHAQGYMVNQFWDRFYRKFDKVKP